MQRVVQSKNSFLRTFLYGCGRIHSQNTHKTSLHRELFCYTNHQSQCCRFSTRISGGSKPAASQIRWFWVPTSVGLAFIALLQVRHIRDRERRKHTNIVEDEGIPQWQVTLFKVLPTQGLSRLWGSLHDWELPVFLRRLIISLWVAAFDCNLEEAMEADVTKYVNLADFFTRKLKAGARVIDNNCDMVCPVDGKVIHFGQAVDNKIEQIKDVSYSLDTFLGPCSSLVSNDNENTGKSLFYCVLYLGPGDYHHFHSPTNWTVTSRRHFPGHLYSVLPWVLRGFKDVLCTNERVALFGNWKYGRICMTAVGAYNVGSIQIRFDQELKTNVKCAEIDGYSEKVFDKVLLAPGDHIGCFRMGSAIVVVFEAPPHFQFTIQPHERVQLGQKLGSVL